MNVVYAKIINYWRIVIIFLVLIGCAYGGFFIKKKFFDQIIVPGYQAIFLINGQVYFGKDVVRKDGYTILKNVHYLQIEGNDSVDNKTKLNLIKLGTEIHGPTDTLYVNDKNILFYEDLRPDSNVIKSIESKSTELR